MTDNALHNHVGEAGVVKGIIEGRLHEPGVVGVKRVVLEIGAEPVEHIEARHGAAWGFVDHVSGGLYVIEIRDKYNSSPTNPENTAKLTKGNRDFMGVDVLKAVRAKDTIKAADSTEINNARNDIRSAIWIDIKAGFLGWADPFR